MGNKGYFPDSKLFRPAREFFHYKRSLITLAVLIVFLSAAAIWNAYGLHRATKEVTSVYVSDVSLQLADDIDYRLGTILQNLQMLEDNLQSIEDYSDPQAVRQLFESKAKLLDFNSLVLVDLDGNIYSSHPIQNDFLNLPGVQASMRGENSVSFLDGQSIAYSVPFYKDGTIVGVLAGVRDKQNMQNLIQPSSFSGQGLTCITDCDGQVIISPTSLDPFLQLDDIFMQNSDNSVVQNIQKMQSDMKNHLDGTFSFTAVDGTELILSYYTLDSLEWVLLTLIPADLISAQTSVYVARTFLIIGSIILLFVGILLLSARIYRIHYRQLEQAAFLDPVTGRNNNAAFQLRCRQLLRDAPPNTYTVALVNIKNFKLINENFGSQRGNEVLRAVLHLLWEAITPQETAARADADNFYLCLRENDPQKIRDRLRRMTEAVSQTQQAAGFPYPLILQQGAYIVEDPALDVRIIQDRAKTACRSRTSLEDGQCIFYDAVYTQKMQREYELNALFEDSLKHGDFRVFLQPKVWVESGTVGGAEALVRWFHPQLGTISPSDFIPIFEQNGKICRLDLFVFEQVCKTLRRWMQEGRAVFPISVNLSRQHFKNPDTLHQFQQIAQQYQIPTSLLELELTESIFFDDQGIEHVKEQIDEMHRMGFQCSLDDFGAGYSSLGLLMEFDVDSVKLDRRFFLDVTRPKTKDVVASITQLSKKIGAHTVAEGIETPEQLEFLRSTKGDMVQGYIYSKPLDIPEFEEWVREHTLDPEA